jgi:rhodanese-related sulfurtransferase
MQTISTDDLKQKLDVQSERFYLIDVLDHASFVRRHIPNAVNIPVDSPDFERRADEYIPHKDTTAILYCQNANCKASRRAAKKLEDLGYTSLMIFDEGIDSWIAAGYPTGPEEIDDSQVLLESP